MMLLNDICRRLFVLFSLKSKIVFTKRTLRMTLAIDVWSCSVWSQSVFDYGHFLKVLLRITGGSCHNYKICCDKGFVCLSRQTWTLRQQKYVCRDKSWTVLVVAKMLFAFWRRKRGVRFAWRQITSQTQFYLQSLVSHYNGREIWHLSSAKILLFLLLLLFSSKSVCAYDYEDTASCTFLRLFVLFRLRECKTSAYSDRRRV